MGAGSLLLCGNGILRAEPLRSPYGHIRMPMKHSSRFVLRRWRVFALLCLLAPSAALADKMTSAQRAGAEEFLAAIAGGGAGAAVFAIHPSELDELRARLLTKMREEEKAGDNTTRSRLFGRGMPLPDIERLTSLNFYGTIASRLSLFGRPYQRVKEVGTIPGPNGTVYALVRGVQAKDSGETEVVELVKLRPYGKDWKATIPEELSAQIDDLIEGRRRGAQPPPASAQAKPPAAGGAAPPAPGEGTPREITELLEVAEKTLTEGKCEEYYKERMSRNFRQVTSKKALDALIGSCKRGTTKDMLLSTLKIVKTLDPKFEYGGQRAVYDLSGQGLPFDRFVLEKVDKRWYIAE